MKIEIDIDEKYPDTEVVIRANKLDSDVERLVAMMRMVNMQIGVRKNDETYLLDVEKILYIEAVERKTFVYTSDETYESDLKLYEIEQELLQDQQAEHCEHQDDQKLKIRHKQKNQDNIKE